MRHCGCTSVPLRRSRRLTWALFMALMAALLVQVLTRSEARACSCGGDEEIDYGPETPVVTKRQDLFEIRLNYRRKEHQFAGGNQGFSEIRVFTRDQVFLAWLQKEGMGAAMWRRLEGVVKSTSCTDLLNGRRIARLEGALAREVALAYRQATRRSIALPNLMLVPDVLDGSEPYCQTRSR